MQRGKIIIITAPSGSGKTTLVRHLLRECPELEFSVSACTRSPRNGEIHGRDYYFYDVPTFQNLINEGAFAEWEMVYEEKYYGTLHTELQRIWRAGKYPMVDIDVQGAINIQKAYPDNSLSIFIKAPSLEVLRERLQNRGTETDASLTERVEKAMLEMNYAGRFNKIIINDVLQDAISELTSIVKAFLHS